MREHPLACREASAPRRQARRSPRPPHSQPRTAAWARRDTAPGRPSPPRSPARPRGHGCAPVPVRARDRPLSRTSRAPGPAALVIQTARIATSSAADNAPGQARPGPRRSHLWSQTQPGKRSRRGGRTRQSIFLTDRKQVPGLHDGRCHNDKPRRPGIFSTRILTGYVPDPARSNVIAKVRAPARNSWPAAPSERALVPPTGRGRHPRVNHPQVRPRAGVPGAARAISRAGAVSARVAGHE